uniref:Small ribosomal subunit protein eS6 n=1 Tax=Geospiza parvula TaxID=87175 RepID=A0A8C3MNC2_GEOPR
MKLNISFPATGCQRLIEVDSGCKLRTFYEKLMWEGYVIWISGGNGKGFFMEQGVLPHRCVCLLLRKEHSCYHPRGAREKAQILCCEEASEQGGQKTQNQGS